MTVPEIYAFIQDWLKMSNDEFGYLRPLLGVVLNDPRFPIWPASRSGKHHGYYGGLQKHVGEVLVNLRRMGEGRDDLDQLVMAVSAVFHDCGKFEEYTIQEADGALAYIGPRHSPTLENHIMTGLMVWTHCYQLRLRAITVDQGKHIAHCIASHHGRREWGAVVVPRTMEALLLHHADVQSVMEESGVNPDDR